MRDWRLWFDILAGTSLAWVLYWYVVGPVHFWWFKQAAAWLL